jgi:hypothetical protein
LRVIGIQEDGQLVFQDDELAKEQPEYFPDGVYLSGETLEEFGKDNLWKEEQEELFPYGKGGMLGLA